jgi:hypothetical protein
LHFVSAYRDKKVVFVRFSCTASAVAVEAGRKPKSYLRPRIALGRVVAQSATINDFAASVRIRHSR